MGSIFLLTYQMISLASLGSLC
eukprot:SAG11_NODE_4237_length_1993_cov_31.578669_1_plen_21_part_10